MVTSSIYPACWRHGSCWICRDQVKGLAIRQAILAEFPELGTTEFDCPKGRSWAKFPKEMPAEPADTSPAEFSAAAETATASPAGRCRFLTCSHCGGGPICRITGQSEPVCSGCDKFLPCH
jgi:hypothetical protein